MAPGTNLSALAHEVESTSTTTLPKLPNKLPPELLAAGPLLLSPSLITQEFDDLRFEAAASQQLSIPDPNPSNIHDNDNEISTLLISSPYNNPGHYLDLTSLDTPNLIFAKALTALKPTRADYATAPYIASLNFSTTVLKLVRDLAAAEQYEWKEQSFYVVIFQSKLKPSIDSELLYKLDYESHREACESGGLLKYWFGKPDAERQNLATCFWRSREDAHKGGLGPWHAQARAAGRTLYEHIRFSAHRFTILDGAEELRFEGYSESV